MSDNVAEQMLKDRGIKCTEIRKVLLSILLRAKNPFSHQEILSHSSMKSFNRVTAYRTLDLLLKANLLHRALGPDGAWRFCVNKGKTGCPGNHVHFFCTKCKKMFCLPEHPIPWIDASIVAEIYSKQLLVYGLCSSCSLKTRGHR